MDTAMAARFMQSPSLGELVATRQFIFMIGDRTMEKLITSSKLLERKHQLVLLAIVFAWALCMWPYLSGMWHSPHDSISQYFPNSVFSAQSMASGQLPFWNPYLYSGYPSIADPQALIFSPLLMVLMLLGSTSDLHWFNVAVALHVLAGGIGFYSLMRSMGFGMVPSALGSVIFMFGGSASSRMQHTGMIISYAYVPWAFFFLKRLLDRPNWRDMLVFGVVSGLMASHSNQVSYLCLLVLLTFPIVVFASRSDKLYFVQSRIVWLVGGGVIAAIVLFPQFYGTMTFLVESNRPKFNFDMVTGSIWHFNLATLVLPDLFGHLSGHTEWHGDRTESILYVGGIAGVLLAYWGGWRGLIWQRHAIGFVAIGAFGVLYLLGNRTPFFQYFFEYIPGVDLYRRPQDGSWLLNIAIAGLVTVLSDRALRGEQTNHQASIWAGRILLFLCLIGLIAALSKAFERSDAGIILSMLASHGSWLVGAAIVLVISIRETGKRRDALLVVLFGFQTINIGLMNFNEDVNMTRATMDSVPYRMFNGTLDWSHQEILDFVWANTDLASEEGGPYRATFLLAGSQFGNAPSFHRYFSSQGSNPLRSARYQAFASTQEDYNYSIRGFTNMRPGLDSTATDFLSIKYIGTAQDITYLDPNVDPAQWPLVKQVSNIKIYENIGVLPRTHLLTDYWEVCSPEEAEAMLSDSQWPYTRSAVIELSGNNCRTKHIHEPIKGELHAKIERYENAEVDILTKSWQSSLLVLNDVLARGWKVYIDDIEQPIYRANYAFRGVKVPPGSHQVTFRYEPFSSDIVWEVLTSPLR